MQDAETQRAEQRASRQTMNAVSQMNQTLAHIGIDTSNLSGEQEALHKAAKIEIANEVLKGTLTQEKKEQIIYSNSQKIAQWTTTQAEGTSAAAQNASSGTKSDTSVVSPSWKQREAETDKAIQRLDEMLESIHVDTFNYSNEQREIVLDTEQRLKDGIMTGTLTQGAIEEIIRNTCKKIATETTPPPGVTYVTIMDPGYKRRMEAEKEERKKEREKSDIDFNYKVKTATKEMNGLLKKEIDFDTSKLTEAQKTLYNNAIRDIQNKLMNGPLTKEYKDQMFYTLANKLSSKVYEYEYTNTHGKKVIGTVTTDELIDPEDNSTGAKIARAALKLNGKERYSDVFMTDKDGNLFSKELDCSKLVYYAIHKANPTFANNTVLGEAARHQIDNLGKRLNPNNVIWRNDGSEGDLDMNQLKPGDLLYWANSKGKVVHTAIYLNSGLMIEANDFVEIAEVREFTNYGDGSGSTLVQVNRLPEME